MEVLRNGYSSNPRLPFERPEALPSWSVNWFTDTSILLPHAESHLGTMGRQQHPSRIGQLVLDGRLLGRMIGATHAPTLGQDFHRVAGWYKPVADALQGGRYVCRLFQPDLATDINAWTKAGVLIPSHCKDRDLLVDFEGGRCLYALRPVDSTSRQFSLLGTCGSWNLQPSKEGAGVEVELSETCSCLVEAVLDMDSDDVIPDAPTKRSAKAWLKRFHASSKARHDICQPHQLVPSREWLEHVESILVSEAYSSSGSRRAPPKEYVLV